MHCAHQIRRSALAMLGAAVSSKPGWPSVSASPWPACCESLMSSTQLSCLPERRAIFVIFLAPFKGGKCTATVMCVRAHMRTCAHVLVT